MRILVAMASPEYLRFYDDTIVQLAQRGHEVTIAVDVVREGKPVRFDAIQQTADRISIGGLIPSRADRWTDLARAVRGTMDFVRYLHPELAPAGALRARVKRQALPSALQWVDGVRSCHPRNLVRVMRGLARLERAIPPAKALSRFLDAHKPDLVLVSPLVEPASDQVDIVRAAHARGIRVAALIASWDNLTNKGDLRVATDLVAVWNEAQKHEAVDYHRVPPANVVVTGAQPFDRWFDRKASRTRDQFCREVGLPSGRPFVLFTGSSIFIARAEVEMPFVREWILALRASRDPAVRDLNVLVRPHPYNGRAWNPDVCADLPGVAVWPRGGHDPVDEENRAGFFDSLFHSEAVVGINTSAMIEAAIVGRPVLSIEAPQFAATQEGTLHFRHLLPENGGFLRVSTTFDEHVGQLSALMCDPAVARDEISRFVRAFIRPQGLDVPSTPILVNAIEHYGASPAPAPMRASLPDLVLRALLYPLAFVARFFPPPAEGKRRSRERSRVARPLVPAIGPSSKASRPPLPVSMRLALVGPSVLAAVLMAAFAGSELFGRTPFAYRPPGNIAEAAGMGIGSEVLRFLHQGEDPRRVVQIRPDIISPAVTRVTALEAAVWSRRVQLIRLLDRRDAIVNDVTRRHLACLAGDIRAADIVQYLAPHGAGECHPGETTRAIQERSR